MKKLIFLLVICSMTGSVFAATPLMKIGGCPAGYSTSGGYCAPAANARPAIEKVGSCPAGYSTSGNYCLGSANSRQAIVKNGSCPSGYSTSGAYCLSQH